MTATAPTTTAKPAVLHFFNTAPEGGYTGLSAYTINSNQWVDDTGTTLAADSLTPASASNGYYNLYINGQLQEGSVVTSVTAAAVTITFGAETTIDEGKIITLVVTNFAPETAAPVITG